MDQIIPLALVASVLICFAVVIALINRVCWGPKGARHMEIMRASKRVLQVSDNHIVCVTEEIAELVAQGRLL